MAGDAGVIAAVLGTATLKNNHRHRSEELRRTDAYVPNLNRIGPCQVLAWVQSEAPDATFVIDHRSVAFILLGANEVITLRLAQTRLQDGTRSEPSRSESAESLRDEAEYRPVGCRREELRLQ